MRKKLKKVWVLTRYDEVESTTGTVVGVYSTWQKAKFARAQFAAFEGWGVGTMEWEWFTLDAIEALLRVQVAGL